jgi:hypothetical protein
MAISQTQKVLAADLPFALADGSFYELLIALIALLPIAICHLLFAFHSQPAASSY